MSSSSAASLIKNTGVFAIGVFGSKVLTALLLPLCTHYVSTEGMGTYDLIYTVVELLKPVAILAIPESLFRWLVESSSNKRGVISSWTALLACFMIGFSVAYWIVYLLIRFGDPLLIYLLIVTGCLYLGAQMGTRGLRNNRLFAVQGIIYALVLCGGSAVLLIGCSMGYTGLLLTTLFANVSATAVMVAMQPELIRPSLKAVSRRTMREMLRYSAALLPNSISWWCINWLSRISIVYLIGVAANGIYSIASRFPTAINMMSQIFQQAWQEHAIVEYGRADREEYFSGIFSNYSRLMASLLCPLAPATGAFIVLFTDPSFAEAKDVVGTLYLAAVFSAFSAFYGTLYLCEKATGGASLTTAVGAVVNIVMSFPLCSLFGLQGAAAAVCASQLVVWIVRVRATGKYCKIRVDARSLALPLALSMPCMAATILLSDPIQLLAATAVGIAVFVLLNIKSARSVVAMLKSK